MVKQVSDVRQQVHRELATLLRLSCSIVEETGIELGENSEKMSEESEHLFEFQQICHDLVETSEYVRTTLISIDRNI